jgi:serine/threonine-protein kinase
MARARLMTNALTLGHWLTTMFGEEIIARRRSRERAVAALERGAPLVIEPIAREVITPAMQVSARRSARANTRIAFLAMALATLGVVVLANVMR